MVQWVLLPSYSSLLLESIMSLDCCLDGVLHVLSMFAWASSGFFPLSKNMLVGGLVTLNCLLVLMSVYVWIQAVLCPGFLG